MSAGWVAGSVRARALARRHVGPQTTRQLASCRSLSDALRLLAATRYGAKVRPEQTLAEAQREVVGTLLWDSRVLAGWLPREGVLMLRTLGAWFEIANVDEMLRGFAGLPADAEFRLGALATAWPRLRQARSTGELRAALAASAWRDPGGETVHAVRLGMRALGGTSRGARGSSQDLGRGRGRVACGRRAVRGGPHPGFRRSWPTRPGCAWPAGRP